MKKIFQTTLLTGTWTFLSALILCIAICSCSKQPPKSNTALESPAPDSEQSSDRNAIFDFAESETPEGNGTPTDEKSAESETAIPKEAQSTSGKKEAKKPSEEKVKTSKEPETKKPAVQPESLHRVVVASFETKSNADKMLKMMIDEGYPAYLKVTEEDGKSVYHVQVGAFESLSNAQALVDELAKKGYKASIMHFK
jgi:cell division septation protein DedD